MELATEVSLGMLILRVALGVTMAAHGYGKIFAGGQIKGTAAWFDSMGMKPGRIHALLAAGGEVLAGLFLALGLLTPFAAFGFVGLMTVAWYTVHRHNGFFIIKEGWEYVFVLGIAAVAIATVGPGEWSLDSALGIDQDLNGVTGLLISAVGGVAAAGGLLAVFFRPPAASS